MKVVSFLTEPAVVDRIIDHLRLTFVAEKPPPEVVHQELLWEADPRPGSFPIPRPNIFRDHVRAEGQGPVGFWVRCRRSRRA